MRNPCKHNRFYVIPVVNIHIGEGKTEPAYQEHRTIQWCRDCGAFRYRPEEDKPKSVGSAWMSPKNATKAPAQ